MEDAINFDADPFPWLSYEFLLRLLWAISIPPMVKYGVQILASFVATCWFSVKGILAKSRGCESDSFVNGSPKVTVIIPAYNEEVGIVKTIESVIRNKYANLTLLVVNDGSTDLTHEKDNGFLRATSEF